MGKISKGILGGFSGTVGTVVGGRWKGIDYIRSRPTISSNSTVSPAQEVHRAKFALAANFLRDMKELLMITFNKSVSGNMTGANSALSYTLKNAVAGVYPDLEIDYKLALVARGNLPNATTPSMLQENPGVIRFKWVNNSGVGSAKSNDKAILVAYCPEMKQCAYIIGAGLRSDSTALLPLPGFVGKKVETWIAFVDDKGKDNSSSFYTGNVVVS